jgi:ribosomal protein S18 acetylase RimI-like enzyme
MHNVTYRRASAIDAKEIAALFRETRERCLPYLPMLHTPDEDAAFFAGHVLQQDTVWVAECRDDIAGFCAFGNGRLDHLYVHPSFQRSGIGSALLRIAMRECAALQLWVFQQNRSAIRFYEAHGFMLVKTTDGADNEERVPDALYRWELDPGKHRAGAD